MRVLNVFFYMGFICPARLSLTTDTLACNIFMFESPNVENGVLVLKESARVNITFRVLSKNCSNVTYGDIAISKYDTRGDIFMPQCKIVYPCEYHPPDNDMSCHCLGIPGLYSISFVVIRKHSATWKWSMKSNAFQNTFVRFNVTYPPRITRLEIVGYDNAYIPQYKSVTVVCLWENGNPLTSVRLLDRNNTLLEKGDKSGNISYTFSTVTCQHSGVIWCDADGSDINMSTTMLIKCPPDFVTSSLSVLNLNIESNAYLIFQFRSHTPIISSCQISRNEDTNQSFAEFVICTNVERNASNFNFENKHCMYLVTGEPPDLQLSIRVRNLKREDVGLWLLTISNDEGSDVAYIQVSIKIGSNPKDDDENTRLEIASRTTLQTFASVGVGIAVSSFTVIIFIIFVYNKKGKETFTHLTRKWKKETPDRNLGGNTVQSSPNHSEIYYEIQDSQPYLETGICPRVQKPSAELNDCPSHTNLAQVQNMTDAELDRMDYLHPACNENENNVYSEEICMLKEISDLDDRKPNLQQTFDCMHAIQIGSQRSGKQHTHEACTDSK